MMPDWLPEFCATDGEWSAVAADLYNAFVRDIVTDPPRIEGCPVWWRRRMVDGHEETFWHLVTRDDAEVGERLFDPRRAERLRWCGAILRHCDDPAVTRWRYREQRGQIRLYLWLHDHDYVVVLEEREVRGGKVYFLISAHHLDGESRRRNLRRKYEKREP
ncbi:MAG: hypothetical protein ABSF98_03460 [Bryobacteraceae bacterium]|jgi:hypothetical protein